MFWGVQIGATDRPTEMDCWSNDSNALTEEVFSRKTFVAIWCAFPYVMMRVRKPLLPVYVCALATKASSSSILLPKMDEKKNN